MIDDIKRVKADPKPAPKKEAHLKVEPVPLKHGPPKKKKLWSKIVSIFATFIGVVLVALILAFVFRKVLLIPGRPPGVDTRSFTHTAQVYVDSYRENGRLPNLDPAWYNDFEMHYAPPLIYLPIAVFYLISGSSDYAGSLIFFSVALFAALSMFYVLRKKYSAANAFLGAIIFSFIPLIFLESRTRILATAFLPLAFYFTNQLLEKRRWADLIKLAIVLALATLSHIMNGLSIMAGLLVYSIIYLIIDKQIPFRRLFWYILASIFSMLLISFYLIPYLIEGGAWTTISTESVINTSKRFLSIWPLLGLSCVLAAIYSTFRHRDTQKTALLIFSLIGIVLSFGVYSPLPIIFSIFRPSVWLFFSAFGFAYLAATAVVFGKIQKIKSKFIGTLVNCGKAILCLIILSIVIYFSEPVSHFARIENPPRPEYDQELLEQFSLNDGRLLPLRDAFQLVYWESLAEETKTKSSEGHYFATTRMRPSIAWFYDNINNGYVNQSINSIAHQNIRYILLSSDFYRVEEKYENETDENQHDPIQKQRVGYANEFLEEMEKDGFRVAYEKRGWGGMTLFTKDKESNYLMPITERVFIIGEYANTLAAVLSDKDVFSCQAGSIYIDDYNPEILKHFDSLVLYGFSYHNKEKAEEIIKEYLKSGGRVVVDLWGIKGSLLEENPNILGVTGAVKKMRGDFSLRKINGDKENIIPTQFILPSEIFSYYEGGQIHNEKQLEEWQLVTYMGLDQPILELNDGDEINDVAGYKEINGSKVWFIGPNVFYHAYLTHNDKEIEFVKRIVQNHNGLNHKDLNEDEKEENFFTLNENLDSELKQFSYSATEDLPLLVSNTYSPHWKAYVDGEEIEIYNFEQLMALNLPSGIHQVEIKYEHLPVHTYGILLTIATLLGMFGFWGLKKYLESQSNNKLSKHYDPKNKKNGGII